MKFSPTVFLLLTVSTLFVRASTFYSCAGSVCFFVSSSGCPSTSQPASIHSNSENAAAASVVANAQQNNLLLGGYSITDGSSSFATYWMDESNVDFMPSGFAVSSEGYIAINSGGSWSVVPWSSSGWSLCSTSSTVSTASSTPVPALTTSSAPTTTMASKSTATPTLNTVVPPPPSLSSTTQSVSTQATTIPASTVNTSSPASTALLTTSTLQPTNASTTSSSPSSTNLTTTTIAGNTTTLASTTVQPNTTIAVNQTTTMVPPNTTVAPANQTVSPGNFTSTQAPNSALPFNQTTFAPPNSTASQNATTPSPNSTVSINTTTIAPNSTNVTTIAPNSTNVTTIAPNSTNATTTVLNTTPTPLSTTAAPSIAVDALIQAISGWFTQSSIVVTSYTANAVDLFVAKDISTALSLFSALQQGYLVGVVVGCNISVSQMVSAVSFDPVTHTASFAVPPDALTKVPASSNGVQWAQSYSLCVGAMGPDGYRAMASTATTLFVQSLLYSLVGSNNSVVILEDAVLKNEDSLNTLKLFNPMWNSGSQTFQSRRLSARAASHLTLSFSTMATVVGHKCGGTLTALNTFVVGMEWGFVLNPTALNLLWSAQTGSICAVADGGDGISVALIVTQPFTVQSTDSRSIVGLGSSISALVTGVSASPLSVGGILSTFISTAAACTDVQSDFVINASFVQPNIADASSSQPLSILLSIASATPTAPTSNSFVCVTLRAKRTVAVLGPQTNGPSPLQLSTSQLAGTSNPLIIISGCKGNISLVDFVNPAQSVSDYQATQNTINALTRGIRVFFAAANASLTNNQKQVVCLGATATTVYQTANGIIQVNDTIGIPAQQAIVCSYSMSQSYMRIDVQLVTSVPAGVLPQGAQFLKSLDAFDAIATISPLAPGLSVRLSSSQLGSCLGNASSSVMATTTQTFIIVAQGAAASNQWLEVCLGTSSPSGTNLFIGTGIQVKLQLFAGYSSTWQSKVGLNLPWQITSGAAVCGNGPRPYALPAENGVFLSPADSWPAILSDALISLGSQAMHITLISGAGTPVRAVYLENRMYAIGPEVSTTCLPIAPLRLSSDQTSFGITAIATALHPLLSLSRSSLYTGLVVSLIDATSNCSDSGNAAQQELIFSELVHIGTSAIDLTPALWSQQFQYFTMCAHVGDGWIAVPQTYVLTSFSGGDTASSWLNQISTGNAYDTQSLITLWHTQQVTWTVYGRFSSLSSNVTLVLVWDDPTCLSAPGSVAIMAMVTLTDNRTGTVSFHVDDIQGQGSRLFSCYIGDSSALAWPLTLEAIYNRSIVIQSLQVSEVQYQPSITISSTSAGDVFIPLTDSLHAPVARVALYSALSGPDHDVTVGCSLTLSPALTDFASVTTPDIFGTRWLHLSKSFVSNAMPSSGVQYFVMCATASSDLNGTSNYQPITAYLVFSSTASSTPTIVDGAYAELVFSPSPVVGALLSQSYDDAGIRSYLKANFDVASPNTVADASAIKISVINATAIAVWVPPGATQGNVALSNTVMTQLYNSIGMATWPGKTLQQSSSVTWTLASVCERELYDPTIISLSSIPYGGLQSGSSSSGMRSFFLFCALVVPVTIAIIVFAIRKPHPGLPATSASKKTPQNASPVPSTVMGNSASKQRQHTDLVSPSPRRPLEFEEVVEKYSAPIPLAVIPSSHDTHESPLYHDDGPPRGDLPSTAPPSPATTADSVPTSAEIPPLPASPKGLLPLTNSVGLLTKASASSLNKEMMGRPCSETNAVEGTQSPPNASTATEPPNSSIIVDEVQPMRDSPQQQTNLLVASPIGNHPALPLVPAVVAVAVEDKDPLLDDDDDDDDHRAVAYDF